MILFVGSAKACSYALPPSFMRWSFWWPYLFVSNVFGHESQGVLDTLDVQTQIFDRTMEWDWVKAATQILGSVGVIRQECGQTLARVRVSQT